MAFKWLDDFHQDMEKPANYAEKTLAAYKLGMKARGSIAGVRLQIDPACCDACSALNSEIIYHPDEAPILPPEACQRGQRCRCVYRPVMTYELDQNESK